MVAMHQLAHAARLRSLPPRCTWPERASLLVHSPDLSSTGSSLMKPASGRRRPAIHRVHNLRSCCAIRKSDQAGASTEGGNAWETNLADGDVRVLAKLKSLYNFVQVLEVSRRADHALAGCKLLLLDRPGNIQSVYSPYKVMTDSYYDVFATLPPLLPDGPVGILGLGAGTAARIVHYFWPHVELHGWELDPSVVMVARQFFDLSELEQGKRLDRGASVFELGEEEDSPPGTIQEPNLCGNYSQIWEKSVQALLLHGALGDCEWLAGGSRAAGRLVVHVGDALGGCQAPTGDGFAGLIVDMFANGAVIPALQQAQTWQQLREHLKPGGRIMVNCGGSCVEADDKGAKDGETTMKETLQAMVKVFPDEVFQFKLPGKGNNSVALTGPSPVLQAWEQALPQALRDGVYDWIPVS